MKGACRTFAVAMCFLASDAFADLGADIDGFFADINFSNVTRPGVYEGQTAGYYTGGGIFMKTPVRSYSLLEVQAPRFRAGCGGIDLFSGGFSFINADQFTEMLRNIGADATSLAFLLAMQVVSPQIKSVVADIYNWAQQANNFQINSCQAAGRALGGALGLFDAREAQCVVDLVSQHGEDYGRASAACRNNPNAASAPGTRASYFTKGNLAWKAMMSIDFFRNDLDLAQAVMNLTGTLLVTDDGSADSAAVFKRIPSQLSAGGDPHSGGMVNAILHGATVSLYGCSDARADESACVDIGSGVPVTIDGSQAIVPRVRALLQKLVLAIRQDQPVRRGSEELGLLRSTSLPVYKYLTVATSYLGDGVDDAELSNYAEIIGKDLLYAYLMDLLKKTGDGVASMRSASNQAEVLEFQDQIRDARSAVIAARGRVMDDYSAVLALTTRTREYEKALVGVLSPQVLQSAIFQGKE